jgi:predicted NBD/HSP70 family sugar kinase
MGYSNKLLILNLIRRNPGISRKDLARITNLDKSTITKITNNLMEKNLITEEGTKTKKTPGRKSIRLIPVKNSAQSIIVKIGVEETYIGIGYLDNDYKTMKSFQTPKDFDKFIDLINENLEDMDYKNDKYVGISFSVPGMVDRKTNSIESAPHLNWTNVNIEEALKKKNKNFDKPILLANEAKLSLLSEIYSNKELKKIHNGLYIFISQGIGGAILIDGKILLGPSSTAGEFGHMSLEPNGDQCFCKNNGCWENYVSIDNIVKKHPDLKKGSSEEKFVELLKLKDKDKKADEIIKDMVYYLSFGISNLVNILNPEFIILGGNGYNFSDDLLKDIKNQIGKRSLNHAFKNLQIFKPYHEIIEACMIGANLLIMDEFSKLIIT